MANHLEQLIAEWYEFQGYFVRRNIQVGKRPKGGYECELDIVALHPEKKALVHIEPSMDTDSWAKREVRYEKKFAAGRKHIRSLFNGLEVPKDIKQLAVLTYGSKKNRENLGGGRLVMMSEIIQEIVSELSKRKLQNQAVPEQFALLRTIQFVTEYQNILFKATK